MSRRSLLRLLLLIVLSVTGAAAQSTISGTVTDAQGKGVAGAKVALRSRGVERMTTTTDSAGGFQFANVDAGQWEVWAESADLMPIEYELDLKAGQPVSVELVLPNRQTVRQQVEVVATREPEDPAQVPAPIQVFGGDELRNRGARDLRSAMALATGVEIAPGGDAGPASSVPDFWGLKEFDAFLLLVDGVPWGGAFNPALTALNLSDVERVEVLRGPAAVTYGATSFVGVINVVNRGVESTERSLTLRGGSHGSGGGSFSTPLPLWGEWKSRLTIEGEREGFADDRTSFARGHGLWRIERKWDAERRFWITGDLNWLDQAPASPRVRDGAELSPLTPVDSNYNPAGAFLNDHRGTLVLGFDRPAGQGWHWYTTASVSYASQQAFRGFLAELDNVPDNARGVRENIQYTDVYFDTHWTRRYPRGVSFTIGTDYLHGAGNAQGADFAYTVPLSGAATMVPQPDNLDFRIDDYRDFLGPYAMVEWSPFERLRLDAGIRLNLTHESQDVADGGAGEFAVGSRTDFRAGGNLGASFTAWQSGQDDVHLYAVYRDTFKPAAIDFGIGEEEGGGGDRILKPETARSVEGGLKGRFLDRRLELEASGFLMDFNNLVMAAPGGGTGGLINGGQERFKGFETGGSYLLRSDLFARATYSYHDARFTDLLFDFGGGPTQLAGKRLEMSANNLFAFGLMYAPTKGFLGGVTVNYTGARFLNKRNTALADGFATVDLSAGYRTRRWELRVDARNLGDARDPVAESELGDAQYYLMTNRRVDGTLKLRF
ncbi:MAG: TonB-dependent receptor [Candidatus Koribacter versatilis]|uniref:TonB-dependent receptor n=1 Tax=Candidatus Korobacter versatilis TaxID=658062 RepID=A0A932A8Q8_9BACT|nr:TonB-dependent receptor [Candidatus Koribacter versatilis]